MKNFPSSLIKQKTTKQGLADTASGTLKNIGSKILKNIFGSGNTGSDLSTSGINDIFNSGYEILDIEHEIDNININRHHKSLSKQRGGQDIDKMMYEYNETVGMNANMKNGMKYDNVYFEDPFLFSSSIFSVINNYKYILQSTVPSILEHPVPQSSKKDSKYHMSILHSVVAPSLFNPYNGVNFSGITENVPLILEGNKNLPSDKIEDGLEGKQPSTEFEGDKKMNVSLQTLLNENITDKDGDISDCTIKKLVELSSQDPLTSELGFATYRYADFMFCKDLGKISNNHLITLRKFPGPIGDNIFSGSYPDGESPFAAYPDIGRLITWFGNDDNKLEDICRFNYHATWKPFTADIQQKPSEQKDEGILDKIANSFSPSNNDLVGKGFSSNTGLLRYASGLIRIPIIGNDKMNDAHYGWELLSNYDQNKIYTPENTIWDTHKYEGKLEFNQDITLTFRYVLRSYANINPKSAFLDLLANIMLVTYRRGSFWGGETKIYGPQGNNSIYKTADVWIDKGFDKLGGIWNMVASGNFSLAQLQGWLSGAMDVAKNVVNESVDKAKDVTVKGSTTQKQVESKVQKGAEELAKLNKKYGWTNALKGMLKNQLGRPALYAFNSLLTGEPVGPWHLTIGNPRNPIMSMGNMIITGSEIQQSGPLGIDDFPSEIKLVVTLKHGRPRDSVEIEKMYTKGRSGIYKPMNMIQLKNYRNNPIAFPDVIMNNLKDFTEGMYNKVKENEINQLQQKLKNEKNANKRKNLQNDINNLKAQIKEPVLAKILRNI